MVEMTNMIRDFTEETLNEFLDKIKIDSLDGVIGDVELTKEVAGENCILHLPEINDYIDSVQRFLKGNHKTYATYKRILEKIFTEARNKDKETGETVTSKLAEIMDPYKESMSQLAACIDVSSLGETESIFNYNKENYHSTYDNSVFGSPGNFIKKIHEVKGGAYTRLFYSVNDYEHNEEELENLKKLIHMEPSEFDSYEAAVIIELINNCIGYYGVETNDETNRAGIVEKKEINYEKLSYLTTLFYEEKEEKSIKKIPDTTKYSLSPNIIKISEYYDSYYKNAYYSNGGLSPDITPYANTNAILKNLCEYYPEIETQPTYAYEYDKYAHEDGLGRWYKDFGININEEEVKNDKSSYPTITISTNEYNKSVGKTYILKMFPGEGDDEKFKKALNISDENLKVNTLDKTFYATFEGGTGYILSKVPGVSTAKDIYDLVSGPVKAHEDSVKHNENLEKNQNDITINNYVSILGMDYNISINKDTMSYNNLTFNDNELKMRVAYYNGVKGNTGADVITTEDAKRYFQEYIDGDSTHISEFYNTLTPSNNIQNDNYNDSSIDKFKSYVDSNLTFMYGEGTIRDNATPEQMDAAIKKTLSDYETGKYRNAVDSPLEQDDMKKEFQDLRDSSPELDDNH